MSKESEDAPTIGARPPWPWWRQRLQAAGFRPSRRFGQNFLVDEGACRRIARSAGDLDGVGVLEVGMGLGFLTRHLVAAGARVLACEIDPRLADLARSQLDVELANAPGSLRVWVGDALAGKHRLADELAAWVNANPEGELVSNLPYSIASPLLALLALAEHPPRAATVLVQQEVADRLCAGPGARAYGALTVAIQSAYSGRLAFGVGPSAFRPRPKVESAVVRLERLERMPSWTERRLLAELARGLFTERRKRMRGPLARLMGTRLSLEGPAGRSLADETLAAAGLDPEVRVEDLGRPEWLALLPQVESRAPLGGPENEPELDPPYKPG